MNISQREAKIMLSIVTALVMLELGSIDDFISISSKLEDDMRLPGGEYISLAALILSRQ